MLAFLEVLRWSKEMILYNLTLQHNCITFLEGVMMGKTATINVRVDEDDKKSAEFMLN